METISVLSNLGSVGAAMVVMYFALTYIRERDKDAKETTKEHAKQMESFAEKLDTVTDKFDSTVREIHGEHRQMISAMFTIQKETVSAMGEIKAEMTSLRSEVRNRDQTKDK